MHAVIYPYSQHPRNIKSLFPLTFCSLLQILLGGLLFCLTNPNIIKKNKKKKKGVELLNFNSAYIIYIGPLPDCLKQFFIFV